MAVTEDVSIVKTGCKRVITELHFLGKEQDQGKGSIIIRSELRDPDDATEYLVDGAKEYIIDIADLIAEGDADVTTVFEKIGIVGDKIFNGTLDV